VFQAVQLLDASLADVQAAVDALPASSEGATASQVGFAADGIARADARAEDISRMARQLLQLLRSYSQAAAPQGSNRGGRAASEAELAGLPSFACRPGSTSDGDVCAICLSNLEPGDALKTMPCAHVYHGACLVEWLVVRANCPLCKRGLSEGGAGGGDGGE